MLIGGAGGCWRLVVTGGAGGVWAAGAGGAWNSVLSSNNTSIAAGLRHTLGMVGKEAYGLQELEVLGQVFVQAITLLSLQGYHIHQVWWERRDIQHQSGGSGSLLASAKNGVGISGGQGQWPCQRCLPTWCWLMWLDFPRFRISGERSMKGTASAVPICVYSCTR